MLALLEQERAVGYVGKVVCLEWPWWVLRGRRGRSGSIINGGDEDDHNKTEHTVSLDPVFIKTLTNMHTLTSLSHLLPSFLPSLLPPHSLTSLPSPHQHEREHNPSLAPDTVPLPLTLYPLAPPQPPAPPAPLAPSDTAYPKQRDSPFRLISGCLISWEWEGEDCRSSGLVGRLIWLDLSF